jgi:phospholipid transport system substrate-binding protein
VSIALISKRSLMAGALGLGAAATTFAAAPLAFAMPTRDPEAEEFVQSNGAQALQALGDEALDHEARARAFAQVMRDFADFERIAIFVLGRYAAPLGDKPALLQDWQDVFRAFALANYEYRLDRFRGGVLRTTGSTVLIPDRAAIVATILAVEASGRRTRFHWRMMKGDAGWRAVDAAVLVNDAELWLAHQQQAQFLAELNTNGGDVAALTARVRDLTATLETRIAAS